MSCHEVVRNLWDYLDGRLDADEASRMRDHMAACLCCFRYRRYQQHLFRRVARLRAGPSSPDSAAVQRRVLLALFTAGWKTRPERDGRRDR